MSFYAFKLDRYLRSKQRLGVGVISIAPLRVQAASLPTLQDRASYTIASQPTATAAPMTTSPRAPSGGLTIIDNGSISRNTPGVINPGSSPSPSPATPSPSAPTGDPSPEGDQDSDHTTGSFGGGYGWAYAVAAVAVLAVVVSTRS